MKAQQGGTFMISAIERLGQEDCFESWASLGDGISSKSQWPSKSMS